MVHRYEVGSHTDFTILRVVPLPLRKRSLTLSVDNDHATLPYGGRVGFWNKERMHNQFT